MAIKQIPAKKKAPSRALIPADLIEGRILIIRGHKVIADSHLAELYQVPTYRLNEAVKRHRRRFPADFMFQLSADEAEALASQFAMSNKGRGGRRTLPYVFTEQGVAMLSTVLNSPRAIDGNIAVMRAFVHMRQWMATHKELAHQIAAMEKKFNHKFRIVFETLRELMAPPEPAKRPIGFIAPPRERK